MSNIINNESIVDDKTISLLRAAIEHRATWMALMYWEAEKMGYDAEKMTRAAIKKCGNIHGERIKANTEDVSSVASFSKAFVNEETQKNFEMDFKKEDNDNLFIEFNYCPLISAWKKLGIEDDKIALLCDIAMDGDRGIAESMGYVFELGDTIAKCHKICDVRFHK